MTIENAVRALAGTLVIAGLAVTLVGSRWGLVIAGFVGLNLIQSSFTGFCPAERIFRRLGLRDRTEQRR